MEKEITGAKKEIWRTVKFVLVSASAGIIEFGSYTLLKELVHLSDWLSYLIGLILSVLWNFTINRRYTFKSAGNIPLAMLLVALFYAVFTPASTYFVKYLTDIGWNGYLVTVLNMLINLVTEFLYQRFVVFRKTLDTNDIAKKEKQK